MADDVENELRGWLRGYLDPAVLRPEAVSRAVVEGRRRLHRRRAIAGGGVAVAMAAATPSVIDWVGADNGTTRISASQEATTLPTPPVTPTESPTPTSRTPNLETPLRMVTRTAEDPNPALYALLRGTLVITGDGCLAVAGDEGHQPMAVLWGHGWTAMWEDGVVVVRDPGGAEFARTGQRVQLGGGGVNRDDSPDAARYADRLCGVDGYWTANDEP